MLSIFSEIDVLDLKENPSDNSKLAIVNKLARNYGSNQLTEEEKVVADQILRLLAKDISKRIRISISEKFCQNTEIPYEVALQLASDMEEFVAVPVIQFSSLLNEEDLLEIVKNQKGEKQRAVARRQDLTEGLKNSLIDFGETKTITTLADNNSAKLSKEQCKKILEGHKNNQDVLRSMIENKKVDDDGTLEIIMNTSEDLKNLIILKYGITDKAVSSIVQDSKEATLIAMIRANMEDQDTSRKLVDSLHGKGEISFPLLIKALGIGAIDFFYGAMAKFAQVDISNVQKVIEEGGEAGTKKLFKKAQIPEKMANATFSLVQIVKKHKSAGKKDLEADVLQDLHSTAINDDDKTIQHLFTILSY